MHYDVHYSADVSDDRRAIIDMIRYIGIRRAKILFRETKKIALVEDDVERNKEYNGLCFSIEVFCGVSGRPIRAMFRRYGGAEQLDSWLNSDQSGCPKVVGRD